MHEHELGDNSINAKVSKEMSRDEDMSSAMESQLAEAAERATFHRVEAERWDRIGRASALALRELRATVPLEQVTAESFFAGEQSSPQPSFR